MGRDIIDKKGVPDTGVPLLGEIPDEKQVCPQCGEKAGLRYYPTDVVTPWGKKVWFCEYCKIEVIEPPKPFCTDKKRPVTKHDCYACPIFLKGRGTVVSKTIPCPHWNDNGYMKYLALAKKKNFKKW